MEDTQRIGSALRRWGLATLGGLSMVLVVTVGAGVARAAAAHTNFDFDVEGFEIINPCNGEVITLHGLLHITESISGDPHDNMIHFIETSNAKDITGTTASGLVYHIVGAENSTATISCDSGCGTELEFTTTNPILLVGTDSATDFFAHSVIHTTILADGTITADLAFDSGTCH
jgi:hypothetical protein